MEILCPECKFSREVDETKIPARSQVATCPKCQTKFKFRELPEEAAATQPAPEEKADDAPVSPPVAQEPTTVEPPAVEPPTVDEVEPTFPKLSAPGEDPKEELWDKLGGMTPPEESRNAPAAKEEKEQQPVPGWTGEFNGDFPDPMQEDPAPQEEEVPMQVPPPFEQLDRYGFFHGLTLTIKLILTSPRLFFSVMPVGGGLAKPLTFTILVTMIQGFMQYFWGLAGLSAAMPGDGADAMGGVSNALAPVLMLLFMPAFIAAGQFIITGIYHLLLILMRADNQGFEGTFRALAYANAPIILGIFPMPVSEIEIAWMAVAGIWGLFLTILGLKHIHKASFAKIIPVALIPLLLAMIGALLLYGGQLPTV